MLASLLYPYDPDAPMLICGWLDELESQGHIRRYQAEDHAYLEVVNFLRHQKIDKPTPSKLPAFGESSSNPRESSRLARVPDPDPIPSTIPVPIRRELPVGLDHVDVARRVGEECKITSFRARSEIEQQAKLELQDGRGVDDVALEMICAWRAYQEAKPRLAMTPGAEKFFGEGMWRDQSTWPLKGKGDGKRDPKGYAAALRELDLEDARDQARADQHGDLPPSRP